MRKLIANVDVYITLLTAVAVAIYSIVYKDTDVLYAVVLSAILVALLSMVALRVRFEDIVARLPLPTNSKFLDELPADFSERLRQANEVWISGVHQHDFFTLYSKEVMSVAEKKNSRLRFLLITPGGAASKMTALRFPPQGNLRQIEALENSKIENSIRYLQSLKRAAAGNFSIRTIDFLLPYGHIVLDPAEPSRSVVYIEHFTFRTRGGSKKPKVAHGPLDEWYQLAKTEFEEMWGAASEVTNSSVSLAVEASSSNSSGSYWWRSRKALTRQH